MFPPCGLTIDKEKTKDVFTAFPSIKRGGGKNRQKAGEKKSFILDFGLEILKYDITTIGEQKTILTHILKCVLKEKYENIKKFQVL